MSIKPRENRDLDWMDATYLRSIKMAQPGSGKSTLTRTLGMLFDLPIYVFNLANLNNRDFIHCWETMLSETPCIALFEDLDAVFKGRDSIVNVGNAQGPPLTFDCLLNAISGVKAADGIFLIVTTNRLEHLDPALGVPNKDGRSTRPGRIDRAIRMDWMGSSERDQLARHILGEFPELIAAAVQAGEGETAAQFQSRCAQLALARFWNRVK